MEQHSRIRYKPSRSFTNMSAVREGVLVVAQLLRKEIIKKQNRKKRCWVKKWIERRNQLGASNTLCLELRAEDEEAFRSMFRVTKLQFKYLLEKIGPNIEKQHTHMRSPIPARLKIEVTLKYLATGDSFGTLSELFRIPRCTISCFLVEVMEAIYTTLEDYIKVPCTEEEWKKIISGFETRWNFPNCVGALDGKHINIKCPSHTGSDYFNYKNTFSVVLMACVDYNYCFEYIDVGAKGRSSDGGIFNECSLKTTIEKNALNIPIGSIFVGDEAFPLKTYLLKPYSRRINLSKENKIYNYRLSRCRRIVENAFGIMVARFRIFEKPIALAPNKVDVVVKTACALHNWLRKTSAKIYTPPSYLDEEHTGVGIRLGGWRENSNGSAIVDINKQNYENNTIEAINLRNQYCHYFNNEGAVPWQEMAINYDM